LTARQKTRACPGSFPFAADRKNQRIESERIAAFPDSIPEQIGDRQAGGNAGKFCE
jgi:hypothetical protein